ncbi:hypothetical protein SAPIO_CDS9641 [Scedosporium apiospermum]|uniref:PIN domain-containing protein n=1 Tax=Pseudallescheria apiosperma TaxID=563466 RepID=A0A084FX81_PSEDA|nr:uncharacterized protein SAPIO_CDS9641 [Scedosporium apiospermum]KEZ39693.1 hypothetical protein SAPIO_CDS9641 [Scedosporium apiospermum]
MGVAKRTRKFAQVKRIIGKRDARLKQNQGKDAAINKKKAAEAATDEVVREVKEMPVQMFFSHNTALVPPYNCLVDTNFITHSVQRKLSLVQASMDLLYAKVNMYITTCVLAELEKLGPKYRLALRVAKSENFEVLKCQHKGIYADDCIFDRVSKSRIFIVGTDDKDLQRRLRKIPGVPIMKVGRGKYVIENMPGAPQ